MEQLLHYVWKHKIFLHNELKTTTGDTIEVINPGIHNNDAGPDFLGATVKIGGILWTGNVEIHTNASDWYRHAHDTNPAYSNIILHVATTIDASPLYPDGQEIPQMQLDVPQYIRDNFNSLSMCDINPRCRSIIQGIPTITKHSWLSSLQVERLEMRTMQILDRREHLRKNWEDTFFVTLARSFGFGKNGDAFELWANSIPMMAVGKHRDSLFQIEAIFFGQAGLLEECTNPNSNINPNLNGRSDYFVRLTKEYRYLQKKFALTPIDPKAWKFLRLRPQNFPHIRIAQLAMLYYSQKINLSKVISAQTIDDIKPLLDTHVSDYWLTHYSFASEESAESAKHLTTASIRLVTINAIVPILFAYGRYRNDENLCERAIALWESLPAEKNRIITDWTNAGLPPQHAADTQALIHLHQHYCQRHDCLRCRFGSEYIRRTPTFMCEDE